MSKKSRKAQKGHQASGALPLDVLQSIVGGAGVEKKQVLTEEHAAGITAAEPAQAQAAQPQAETKPLSKDEIKKIEDRFRTDPTTGKISAPAGTTLAGTKAEWAILGDGPSWKDAKFKKVEKGTAYEQRDREAQAAKGEHENAQATTKLKSEILAGKTEKLEKSAKDWAAVKAAENELEKAKKAASEVQTYQQKVASTKADMDQAHKALDAARGVAKDAFHEANRVKDAEGAYERALKKFVALGGQKTDLQDQTKIKTIRVEDASKLNEDLKKLSPAEKRLAAAESEVIKTREIFQAKQAALKAYGGDKLAADFEAKLTKASDAAMSHMAAKDQLKVASEHYQNNSVPKAEDELHKAREAAKQNSAPHDVLKSEAENAAKRLDQAKNSEAKAKAKADDLAARNSKAAVDAEKKQADRHALKNMAENEGWSKGTSYAHDVSLRVAKEQAIKAKTYEKVETEEVLSGGVTSEEKTTNVGDKTVTDKVTGIGQTKIETLDESYSANGVSAGKSVQTWKGEIGKERSTTIKDANGATITHTDKAYGSLTGEKYGKYEFSDVKKAIEVGAKATLHGELSTSTTTKIGDAEHTHTVAAVVDGSIGGKAGASIGIDGVKLNASVCAEITAKVCDIHEVKIGDLSIKNELTVYATAKAEARASAEVNFNPLAGEIKAKASLGAEASAGIGIEDTLSINKNLDVGGGAYIGKIGAKADVDVGLKDGKLSVKVDVGAALGVGVNVKFNANVDVASTVSKAADEIKNGNIAQKAGGVLSFLPTVFLIRGLFG